MTDANSAQYKPGLWSATKETISEYLDDDAFTLAAAIAYYTALSFAPLLILAMWATSKLGPDAQQQMIHYLHQQMGDQAGQTINTIINSNKKQPSAGTFAGIVSFATLFFSATGVFAQLQAAMNRIWNVQPRPGAGVWNWVRKRGLVFGLVLGLAFILLVSMIVSTAISNLFAHVGGLGALWRGLSFLVSAAVFVGLFAVMFKYLPDVKIQWRDTWFGAVVTAVLFVAGKYGISLYLGRAGVGSSYGAAGSLIALLVWAYYSGLIFFFGAEVTQVWARRAGTNIQPDAHAVRVEPKAAS